jgi:hypothetical protein
MAACNDGKLSGVGTNDCGIAANDNVESIIIVPPYTDDEGEYFVPTASSFTFVNSTISKKLRIMHS